MNGIKDWIQVHGIPAIVPSIVRLAMGAIVGWLLKLGLVDEANKVQSATEQVAALATAAATAMVGVYWSMKEKARTVPTTPKAEALKKGIEYAVVKPSEKK